MSWGLGGIAGTALALIALQVLSSAQETSGLLSLAGYPAKLAARWMDPGQPLVPQLATAPAATTAAPVATTAAPATTTAPTAQLDVATLASTA